MSVAIAVGDHVELRQLLVSMLGVSETWVRGWVTEVAYGKVTVFSPFTKETRVYPDPSPDWRAVRSRTP